LIEFGRFAAPNRARRGEGKPDTFTFLGFTHICSKARTTGKFTVWRHTERKRMRAKLRELKLELRKRLHQPIRVVGQWLRAVLRGHFNYYGVTHNSQALGAFRYHVSNLWFRSLRRRSQKATLTWARMSRIIKRWLPPARIVHSAFAPQQLVMDLR
jgi:RNA-directed DNA polymerase